MLFSLKVNTRHTMRTLGNSMDIPDPDQTRFKPSTFFLVAACLSAVLPILSGAGAHDGGWPVILLFLGFPAFSLVAFVLATVNLIRRRTTQSRAEFTFAALLFGVLGLLAL